MTVLTLPKQILVKNGTEKEKNSNTSVMDDDNSNKCVVTDHSLWVYGYDPPVMLYILKKNLYASKVGI